jgi:hypothetical protein
MTSDVREPIRVAILNPQRLLEIPSAPQRPLMPDAVSKGLLEFSPQIPSINSPSNPGPSHTPSIPVQSTQAQVNIQLDTLSRKCTLASLPVPACPNPKQ